MPSRSGSDSALRDNRVTPHPLSISQTSRYRGRFAPSPTGALHFGSLIVALGSYLEARSQRGEWLVRMEDIDPLREIVGAADRILFSLEAHGLAWDGPVLYQSSRTEHYMAVIDHLLAEGDAYRCSCSRKEVVEHQAAQGRPTHIYPGLCRNGPRRKRVHYAIRLNSGGSTIAFEDRLQGHYKQRLEEVGGDFVIRRADGLVAYQLAVVVDDADQEITEVVRGSDLLDSTPRQIFLQQRLGYPTPAYLHLPLAVNEAGQKLSKQTCAPALDDDRPVPAIWHALAFLGQAPEPQLLDADVASLIAWGVDNWDMEKVPHQINAHYSGSDPAAIAAYPD